jgi:hypothetical protein
MSRWAWVISVCARLQYKTHHFSGQEKSKGYEPSTVESLEKLADEFGLVVSW